MNSADVFAQIETMGELPSLPRTLLSIQQVASDERSSADDLARVILRDQALTLRVLKVVNSALYQRRQRERVRTARRAVVVMGFQTVRKLALGLSVFDMMSKLSRSPQLGDVARHSLVTAGVAQLLAEACGRVRPEEAFVAGLVHDIGKVVLCECSPRAMDAVQHDVSCGAGRLAAERRHFGLTHDRAGRRLAQRWRLPEDLQNLIGDHHDIDPVSPPRGLDPALAVLVFANAIAHGADRRRADARLHTVVRQAMRRLKIPAARQEDLLAALEAEVVDLAAGLGVEPADLGAYRRVINVEGSASVAPRRLSDHELARRTAEQLALYQRVGTGLARGDDPANLRDQILAAATDVLEFERVVLLRVDRPAGRLRRWAGAGPGAEDLGRRLALPLERPAGALALAVLEQRTLHVPDARSAAYGDLVGDALLHGARCRGFAAAPVFAAGEVVGLLYADGGADGRDVVAEQASELDGLASQLGLVCGRLAVPA
jgi:putative nucleotidyltransferase with HDIG domain